MSQIKVLMKARLESKVAKTTGLLTAAVISSSMPLFVIGIFRNAVPVFRTNAVIRYTHGVQLLSSLSDPFLDCYRDHRFRNAIRELLGMKKAHATQ